MSDTFSIGLLVQLVEKLQQQVDSLELRVEELESLTSEEETGLYLDGTPIQ